MYGNSFSNTKLQNLCELGYALTSTIAEITYIFEDTCKRIHNDLKGCKFIKVPRCNGHPRQDDLMYVKGNYL